MSKGRTLWERLTKTEEPVELQCYNPLKAKIGTTADINLPDYDTMTFLVREVREVTRRINGKTFQFCDYSLVARPIGGDDVSLRLRICPVENPRGDMAYDAILLRQYDELSWEENFLNAAKSEQFSIEENGESTDYWRPSIDGKPIQTTWEADVVAAKEMANVDDPGKNKVGTVNSQIEYWDFSRMTKDVANQEFEQFLFIEMDKENGMFRLWQGEKIDPHRVRLV